jgi:DNA-binding response OmpR family regulator
MRYYISIETNIEVFERYRVLWQKYGVTAIRANSMTEGIEKAIEIEKSKTDELYFIDIVADDISYMPQLSILSERTIAPILIATFNPDNNEHHEALRNGADFYGEYCETSEQNINAVISFIESVNRRSKKSNRQTELIFYKKILISISHRYVFVNDKEAGLNKTEFDVLYYLVKNRGQILSYEEIYKKLWGKEQVESVEEAVRSVIKRLRKKIDNQDSKNTLIQNVRSVGYRLTDK